MKMYEPTNCPFYGHAMLFTNIGPSLHWMLIPTNGNQCAMKKDSHSPCQLEIEGMLVDWSACPVFAEHVAGRSSLFKVKSHDK